MASSKNFVWAAGYAQLARIAPDRTFLVYDTHDLPPYRSEERSVLTQRPMAVDQRELVWLGTTDSGACYFDTANFNLFLPTFDTTHGHFELNFVSLVKVDASGDYWFGGPNGLIKLDASFNPQEDLVNGQLTLRPGLLKFWIDYRQLRAGADGEDYPQPVHILSGIVEDQVSPTESFLWVGVGGFDFRRVHVIYQPGANPPFQVLAVDKMEDRDGNGYGFSRVPGGFVSDMLLDRAGKIWAVTLFGAVRFEGDPRAINPLDVKLTWYNLFNYNGAISLPFRMYDPKHSEIPADSNYLVAGCAISMVQDSLGNIWFLSGSGVLTGAGKGLAVTKSPDVLSKPYLSPDDLIFFPPGSLENYPDGQPDFICGTLDYQNNLWFGSAQGVSPLLPGPIGSGSGPRFDKLIEIFNSQQYSDRIKDIAVGPPHAIADPNKPPYQRLKWFATDRGLYSYNGYSWQHYGPTDSSALVSNTPLNCVVVDPQGQVYYGSDDGIISCRRPTDPPDSDGQTLLKLDNSQAIISLVFDKQGRLWAGTDNGLYLYDGKGQFNRTALTEPIYGLVAEPNPGGGRPAVWAGSRLVTQATVANPTPHFSGRTPQPAVVSVKGNLYGVNDANTPANLVASVDNYYISSLGVRADGAVLVGTTNADYTVGSLLSYAPGKPLTPVDGWPSTSPIRAIKTDIKGRLWIGTRLEGIYVQEDRQTAVWTHLTTLEGLVYSRINQIVFEPNPYKTNPTSYVADQEDWVFIATEHGLSHFSVATPATNFEPNFDRFIGFPLVLDPEAGKSGVYKTTVTPQPRLIRGSDGPEVVDWFKVKVSKRYTTLKIWLTPPPPYDLDLFLYPPARKSSSNSAIFANGGDVAQYMEIPTGISAFSGANLAVDATLIKQRNGLVGFSVNRGSVPEYIEAILSLPLATGQQYYQIGVVLYDYMDLPNETRPSYTLTIQLEEPASAPPATFDKAATRRYSRNRPLNPATRALVLTHSGRFAAQNPGQSSIVGLLGQLNNAAGWKGAFEVIDLQNDPTVQAAYTRWDQNPQDPEAANNVCEAIRYLIFDRLGICPNLTYLVIAGGERVVPYYRVPETVGLGPEHKYADPSYNPLWKLPPTDPISVAFLNNHHFSDSFYATLQDIPWNGRYMHIPELAIGRLVESYSDIQAQINTFLGGPLRVNRAMVTSYDFLTNLAGDILTLLKSRPVTINSKLTSNSWTADNLRQEFYNSGLAQQLFIWNSHFSHLAALSAAYDQKSLTENQLYYQVLELLRDQTHILRQSLVITPGCHSGLNLPGSGGDMLDFAQVLAGRGSALMGNTGFGYGDSEEVFYSELLVKLVVEELLAAPSVPLGMALIKAKQRYYLESGSVFFTEYDEKALNIFTLYGLPMQSVEIPTANGSVPVDNKRSLTAKPGAGPKAIAGTNLQVLTVNFNFDFTNELKRVDSANGSYFAQNDPGRQFVALPAYPILPRFGQDLEVPEGYEVCGVRLASATYQEIDGFEPAICNPTADLIYDPASGGYKEDKLERDFFFWDGWAPAEMAGISRLRYRNPEGGNATGLLTGQAPTHYRLVVTPVQVYNPDRARLYSSLSYEVYLSPRIPDTGPVVSGVSSTLDTTGGQAHFTVGVRPNSEGFPPAGIYKVVILYTYLDEPNRSWRTFELSKTGIRPDGSEVWGGTCPVGNRRGIFFTQVIDLAGNVTTSTNKGVFDTWLGHDQLDLPQTFRVRLEPVGGCSSNGISQQLRLFLQAVGSELGTGINRINYQINYTGQSPLTGAIAGCWGTVDFATKNLQSIEFWADDTSYPTLSENSRGGSRRTVRFVTSTADSGPGTLREALKQALRGDFIGFLLPVKSNKDQPAVIELKSELPTINVPDLTIDGLLPGCDGKIRVMLRAQRGNIDYAWRVTAPGVTIRGLGYEHFNRYVIWLDGSDPQSNLKPWRCRIEQNQLSDKAEHRVGIALSGDCMGNIIRGNQLIRCNQAGLLLQGSNVRANIITGNYIGVTKDDGSKSGGQQVGIRLEQGAHHNKIGGGRSTEANYIAGNVQIGLEITGNATTANQISGNYFGYSPVPDTDDDSTDCDKQHSAIILDAGASGNQIAGNFFLNHKVGVVIREQASHNQVLFNYFRHNQECDIRIGENRRDGSVENTLTSNCYQQTQQPIQLGGDDESSKKGATLPNAGIQPPRGFSVSTTNGGQLIQITAPAGSTVKTGSVEVYLVQPAQTDPDKAQSSNSAEDHRTRDYTLLGSFESGNDGSLAGKVWLAPAHSGAGPQPRFKKPDPTPSLQIALTVSDQAGNTSEFSQSVSLP